MTRYVLKRICAECGKPYERCFKTKEAAALGACDAYRCNLCIRKAQQKTRVLKNMERKEKRVIRAMSRPVIAREIQDVIRSDARKRAAPWEGVGNRE